MWEVWSSLPKAFRRRCFAVTSFLLYQTVRNQIFKKSSLIYSFFWCFIEVCWNKIFQQNGSWSKLKVRFSSQKSLIFIDKKILQLNTAFYIWEKFVKFISLYFPIGLNAPVRAPYISNVQAWAVARIFIRQVVAIFIFSAESQFRQVANP